MTIHTSDKGVYRALLAAAVLASTLAFSSRVTGQARTTVGSIGGTVRDSSIGPISGLRISALQGGHQSTTDAQGRFELDSIPAGEVTHSVSETFVSYTRFSIGLFRSVASESPDSNIFISPASAAFVLAMTAAGASGSTWTQMKSVLGVEQANRQRLGELNAAELRSLASQNGVILNIANSVWAAEGVPFSSTFLRDASNSYRAEVHTQKLHGSRTKDQINNWASTATKGRIPVILDDTLPDTARMVLLNAVYFKGKWLDRFDSSATSNKPFHLSPRHSVRRQFMARQGDMLYAADTGIRILRLPYQGERVAMYIILPDSSLKLSSVVGRLSSARWADWMQTLTTWDVHLQMPRFRLESGVSFLRALQALGMTMPFDCDSADFTEMLPRTFLTDHHMCISQVAQRAFIEVNEIGTEAAAVTRAVMVQPDSASIKPPPVEFNVDRPFVVAIRDDRTGLLLFLGQITDPKQQP